MHTNCRLLLNLFVGTIHSPYILSLFSASMSISSLILSSGSMASLLTKEAPSYCAKYRKFISFFCFLWQTEPPMLLSTILISLVLSKLQAHP